LHLSVCPKKSSVPSTSAATPNHPVQAQAIPRAFRWRPPGRRADGTGKTAGFTLPILQLLTQQEAGGRQGRDRALVLIPRANSPRR